MEVCRMWEVELGGGGWVVALVEQQCNGVFIFTMYAACNIDSKRCQTVKHCNNPTNNPNPNNPANTPSPRLQREQGRSSAG